MRCYGFFESGREVIKALYQRGAALPIGQDDLALSCGSGASTAPKNISGTVLYLFTEKAVKKLLRRPEADDDN
ncbi:hypothetical protein A45J_0008 [hot springs metagenome]|uniref:Uncharacterized protein n=1 Tax=hot springs metagenome TaxID=433727 RepID=A0A5J4KXP0_9ZZZZ